MSARMRVELIPPFPSSLRTDTAWASPPKDLMRRPRSPASPAARWPNLKFSPTTTTSAPISPTSISRTNSSGLFFESSLSNRISRTSSTPYRSKASLLSSSVVSSFGWLPGVNTARGCGSKVAATTLIPLLRPSSMARRNTAWCPRCTPSKFPRATTTPRTTPPRPCIPRRHPGRPPGASRHPPEPEYPTAPHGSLTLLVNLCRRQLGDYLIYLYYAVTDRGGGELVGVGGLLDGEVADPAAAEGGEVGAGLEVRCEVGDEGSRVGSAAAGDLEAGRLFFRVSGGEGQRVDPHAAGFTFDGHAAAVEVVEADTFELEGGGHWRDLEEVAGEVGEGGADGALFGHRGVQGNDAALGVQSVGDGAEACGDAIGFVEVCDVASEAGGASDQEYQETRGQGVEGAGVPDLGLSGEETLDLRDRPGARDAGRLVEEQGARWSFLRYRRSPPRSA